MAEGVRTTVIDMIQKERDVGAAEAEKVIEDMKAKGNYYEETFGAYN